VRWHNNRFHSRPGYVADYWNSSVNQHFTFSKSGAVHRPAGEAQRWAVRGNHIGKEMKWGKQE
jgi:hypothetical protein